jgi:hypothetical protein
MRDCLIESKGVRVVSRRNLRLAKIALMRFSFMPCEYSDQQRWSAIVSRRGCYKNKILYFYENHSRYKFALLFLDIALLFSLPDFVLRKRSGTHI